MCGNEASSAIANKMLGLFGKSLVGFSEREQARVKRRKSSAGGVGKKNVFIKY